VHSAAWSLGEMERWLICVNQLFPLCLKTLFYFKNRQLFLAHPVYKMFIENIKDGLGS
jgi:hypothetical protein